jgi:hypothetical protein
MDILISYDTIVVNGRALLIAFPALAELLTRFTSSSNPFGICRSISSRSNFFTINSYKIKNLKSLEICSYRETPYPPLVLFPEAA